MSSQIIINDYSTKDINKYTHIIHISDIHIRLYKRQEEYKEVFQKLYQKIDEVDDKNGLIVITGDIFHDKVSLTSESVILCTEFFINLSKRRKTIVIPGNHDGLLNSYERVDNISGVLSHKTIPDLYFFKHSGIYRFNNFVFGVSSIFDNLFISSYEVDGQIASYKDSCGDNKFVKIGLYHGLVGTLKLQEMYEAKGEKSIEDFKGYDYVLLGDIHTFQYLNDEKTIAYASSLISQNFTETDTNHGFIYWDIENGSSSYVSIPNDYHHKICFIENNILKVNNVEYNLSNNDDLEILNTIIPEKGRVKLIIEQDINSNNEYINLLKGKFKKVYWTEVNNTLINKGKSESSRLTNVDINIREIMKEIVKFSDESKLDFIYNDLKQRLNKREDLGNNWDLLELRISNLCLYGANNSIDLSKFSVNDIILIHGQNNVGKSSLIDIISYILYNKMGRNLNMGNKKAHEILNINKKEGVGEIIFKLSNNIFFLKRTYKKNIRNDLKFDSFLYTLQESFGDDCVSTNKETIKYDEKMYNMTLLLKGCDVNKKIEELLGSYDDFIFMNIMLQFDNVSFRNMKQNERKNLLNRLLDLNGYEKIEADIKPIYQMYEKESKTIFDEIKDINIIEMKNSHEDDLKNIDELNNKIKSLENNKLTIIDKINNLNMEYVKIDDFNSINSNSSNSNSSKIKLEEEVKKAKISLEKMKGEVSNLSKNLDEKEQIKNNIFEYLKNEESILENWNANNDKIEKQKKELQLLLECSLSKRKQHNMKESYDEKTTEILLEKNKKNYDDLLKKEIIYNELLKSYDIFMIEFNEKQNNMNSNLKMLEYDLEKINVNKSWVNERNTDKSLSILVEKKEKEKDLLSNDNNNELIIHSLSKNIDEFEKEEFQNKCKSYHNYKNELDNILNEIIIYTDLMKNLENHEFNLECIQCMKNPKVLDLIKYSDKLKSLELSKINIEKELNELKDIEKQENEYKNNKKELNEKYKSQNEIKKELKLIKIVIDDLIIEIEYFRLIDKIKDEKNKWANDPIRGTKEKEEKELNILKTQIEKKQIIENNINKLEDYKNILLHNNELDIIIKNIKTNIDELINGENNKQHTEEYNNYLKQKQLFSTISMEIMKINVSILEKNNLITKDENIFQNLSSKLETINKNTEIITSISNMKSEIKNIDFELNKMKNDKYKLDELIRTNDIIIKNYDEKKARFLKLFDEKEVYANYMILVNKNGLPLHILKRYLTHISDGINFIAESFIKKKIDLFIEDNDIVLNIIVKDDNNKNRNIMMVGGRESFVLDIAFKIVLAKIAHLPKSNFIFIDEGISVFDKEHLNNITDLFSYLNNYFDYVFLMSHIEEIKDYVSKKIYIKRDDQGCSKISYNN
jgi:DNA repair exonuclease SbcCD ATPase subunit/DNA repair exonuclease SbcCD nuclease subunit